MSLIVSLALLLALVPGGVVPTAAQAQPTAPDAPASESLNALSNTESAEISTLSVPSAASVVQVPGIPFGYTVGEPFGRLRTASVEPQGRPTTAAPAMEAVSGLSNGHTPAFGPLAESADESAHSVTRRTFAASSPPFELPANLPGIETIYPLSEAAKARLRANGFVVLPDVDVEYLSDAYWRLFEPFCTPYVLPDEEKGSVFITSDAALHLFHNVFDGLLAEVEKDHLYDDVEWLVQQVYTASVTNYAAISDTHPLSKEAARHDVLVFAVAARLLDDSFVPPDYVEPDASQYVQKVLDHTVTEFYPGDDYTQYEPRGHYAGDEQLERYFRAVKWLGRRIFRIEDYYYPDDADVELIAAALLAQIITDNPDIEARWNKVYDVTRLLTGPADSITPPMVQQALDNVFGPDFTLDMLEDEANRAALRAEFERDIYPTSEIIPVPLEFPGQIPPKYAQFLGERYLPDAEAMQETCFPHVPTRFLPSGLDVMATVLASDRAKYWLADDIAAHPELDTQIDTLRAQFDAYTVTNWTKSIYNGWLYSLRPLLQPMPASAPAFMQGAAWQDKELNTALGSWTQLRHDFILYGKQTYYPLPWAEGLGLVEPVPDTFGRLADLCDQVHGVLDGYDMLPEAHDRSLQELADELRIWRDYAQKVADGDWLSEGEQTDVCSVGRWLRHFFDDWGGECVEEKSAMLVADVASDSNTARVLHEGTGHFNPLIVIYTPPGGEPIAGIGYVFSHYEFVEPDWNRLSDAEWETRLQEDPPPRPVWTSSFLPGLGIWKSASSDLVEPGDLLTYTITVQNAEISGTLDVTITDNIPAHTIFAWADSGGSLAGDQVRWVSKTVSEGSSLTVSFAVSVTSPLPDGTVITNDDYSVTWSEGMSAVGAPITTTTTSVVLSVTVDPTSSVTLCYTDTQGSLTAIQVPAGAVTEVTTLSYTPVEIVAVPSGFAFAGHAFDLEAYRGGALLPGFTFSIPVTITIYYTDTDVAGLDENTLVLEYWNDSASAWEDAACGSYKRHPEGNWLSVPINHLSRFGLFGPIYQVYLPLILRSY